MTTETPTPTDTPEPVAPDGTATAVRVRAFGGIQIGWGQLATTIPIYVGLVIIWIYFNSQTGNTFISARNLSEMAQEFSYEAVLAIGVVFVLLLGEIDLSLGNLTLLSVALVADFSALSGWGAGKSIILTIILCTVAGLVQGMLIAWMRMPSFVVTLGGFLVFQGIADHILSGATINIYDPFIISLGTYYLPDTLSWILAAAAIAAYIVAMALSTRARAKAGLPQSNLFKRIAVGVILAVGLAVIVWTMNDYTGVPVALAILAGFTVALWFFSIRLPLGRHIYAVGGNLEAARRAGINTTMVRWIVFGLSGMLAGVAGVMLAGYGASGSTTVAGPNLLLDVISIAVIGGVSLTGGKGSVWAVMVGGLVIASLDSGLNLMAIDPSYSLVIKGTILLIAIFIDILGKRWDELPFKEFALTDAEGTAKRVLAATVVGAGLLLVGSFMPFLTGHVKGHGSYTWDLWGSSAGIILAVLAAVALLLALYRLYLGLFAVGILAVVDLLYERATFQTGKDAIFNGVPHYTFGLGTGMVLAGAILILIGAVIAQLGLPSVQRWRLRPVG